MCAYMHMCTNTPRSRPCFQSPCYRMSGGELTSRTLAELFRKAPEGE